MPLLALEVASSVLYSSEPTGTVEVGSSFLHPAYMLQDSQIFFPNLSALPQSRAGEDVLSSDILAFDVKAYDPGVPLLPSLGADGQPGIAGVDDDGVAGVDSLGEVGWSGSDDLVLSPNDPGYATALGANAIGTGEYVDVGWARKVMLSAGSVPANANLWSQLSGFSQTNYALAPVGSTPFTDALYKSGLVIQSSSALLVHQPSYDTWTSSYEGDGFFQAERVNSRGVVVGTGSAPRDPWRLVGGTPVVDAGTDGLDNFSSVTGVDDPTELETSPPFPTKLRGLSITIRMEDPATRTVKQMSVGKEFVTQ